MNIKLSTLLIQTATVANIAAHLLKMPNAYWKNFVSIYEMYLWTWSILAAVALLSLIVDKKAESEGVKSLVSGVNKDKIIRDSFLHKYIITAICYIEILVVSVTSGDKSLVCALALMTFMNSWLIGTAQGMYDELNKETDDGQS